MIDLNRVEKDLTSNYKQCEEDCLGCAPFSSDVEYARAMALISIAGSLQKIANRASSKKSENNSDVHEESTRQSISKTTSQPRNNSRG